MIAKSAFFCVAAVLIVIVESMPVDDMNTSSSLGSPFFDEIVVESTLTVRGKGGAARQSRGKKLELAPPMTEPANKTAEPSQPSAFTAISTDGASVELKRNKRQGFGQGHRGRRPYNQGHGGFRGQNQPGQFQGQRFPSASAASANAASQGFNVAGPNGFGASASNAGSQGFQVGPNGISGSAGQAASQTYRLPNGNTLNVAFSNGFNVGPNGASQSGSNALSVTGANGQQQFFRG